jgi:hypothetical protein
MKSINLAENPKLIRAVWVAAGIVLFGLLTFVWKKSTAIDLWDHGVKV